MCNIFMFAFHETLSLVVGNSECKPTQVYLSIW